MVTGFTRNGTKLVASMGAVEPRQLEGGGVGWFERAQADWRWGWKLRLQCSITQTNSTYGYGNPHPDPVLSAPGEEVFRARNNSYVQFIVAGDTLRIEFLLPDCLDPVGHNHDLGCSAGGPVSIRGIRYHCSAGLKCVAPSFEARLDRVGNAVRFVQSYGVTMSVLEEMPDKLRGRPIAELLRARALERDQT